MAGILGIILGISSFIIGAFWIFKRNSKDNPPETKRDGLLILLLTVIDPFLIFGTLTITYISYFVFNLIGL